VARIENSGLFKFGAASSASVAKEAYRAMMKGRRRVIHGLRNRILAFGGMFAPQSILLAIAARLNRT
jgi:short-subunit dehydrogenase